MKVIKDFGPSVIWLFLLAWLVMMMVGHFHHVAGLSDPLDKETVLIHSLKRKLPRGMQAAFATNLSDDEASQRAWYQSQFGWCPLILSDDVSMNDNILLYKSSDAKDSDMVLLHHCDTLGQRQGEGYTLLLLHKTTTK